METALHYTFIVNNDDDDRTEPYDHINIVINCQFSQIL